MDQVVLGDRPSIRDGYIWLNDKPGLGIELNRNVVESHLAQGETWW